MIINSYNISRSLLAFSTLITLVTNSDSVLFGNELLKDNLNGFTPYNLFYLFGDQYVWLSISLAVLILLITIIGVFPRITGILHWYVAYSFFLSCDLIDGGDHIAANLALFFIPLTLLDSSKNHWKPNMETWNKNKDIRSVLILLLKLQVCVIYFHAFAGKLFVDEWANGTAVYYWFTHPYFGVHPSLLDTAIYLLSNEYIVSAITWGTLLLEFILASAILLSDFDWNKRRNILTLSLIFHLSIIFVHGLVSFFFVMASALVIYLVPQTKIKSFKLG